MNNFNKNVNKRKNNNVVIDKSGINGWVQFFLFIIAFIIIYILMSKLYYDSMKYNSLNYKFLLLILEDILIFF